MAWIDDNFIILVFTGILDAGRDAAGDRPLDLMGIEAACKPRRSEFSLGFLLVGSLLPASVAAEPPAGNTSGFTTERPSMLTPVMSGVEVEPILTVGSSS